MISNSENKRLAKNTIFLYVRMILTMLVGLYTSRVILQVLGVSDFGVFNIVGGTISLFAFLNTALTGGTQRFLSFALGKNGAHMINKVFQVAFSLHVSLAVFFFILMEFVGILLLYYILNIPDGRVIAAKWVFHCCTIAICIDLIRMLFDADIIANERMDFYAYLSIFEVFMRLFVVYLLTLLDGFDKLKLYSVLYLSTAIIMLIISSIYCKIHFKEAQFKLSFDKSMAVEIGNYTGWNILSHISFMISQQGTNIVLNVFFNTIMNAARGISVQVYGALNKLTANYLFATMPQIIKLYASGKVDDMYMLVKNVSKFSVYLYLYIALPLFIEMDYILQLWLAEVPPHTAIFSKILVVNGYIFAISNPITRILTAAGKIKEINLFDFVAQIVVFLIMLVLLNYRVDVDFVMCLTIIPSVISFLYYLYAANMHTGVKVSDYFTSVIPKISLVTLSSLFPTTLFCIYMEKGFPRFCGMCLISTMSISLSVFFLGIDKDTRRLIIMKIFRVLNLSK